MVTGGLGFIGSHFIRHLYYAYPQYDIINLDTLTYAGNTDNLADIEQAEAAKALPDRRYEHVRGNICDEALVERLFAEKNFALVFHFAAETHVDRSIFNFGDFVRTNVEGTRVLLDAVRRHKVPKMIQISTDEVYGNVPDGYSTEDTPFNPSSPYSASKAAGDMLAKTYAAVYGTPVVIIRGSNNYGTHQYPEKLIPLAITNLLNAELIPVHGNGEHVRSWLHVADFCRAIDLVAHAGPAAGIYNVAGEQKNNLEIIQMVADGLGKDSGKHIVHVGDRPSADLRYAPHAGKLEQEFGWRREHAISDAIHTVVEWYRTNEQWWRSIKSKKEFADHYEKQSKARWY